MNAEDLMDMLLISGTVTIVFIVLSDIVIRWGKDD